MRSSFSSGFSPDSVSAVGAWLRNLNPAGAISSLTDVLNPANTATQATALRQPTSEASGAILCGDDSLQWPIAANNNPDVTWGWAGWIELDDLTAAKTICDYGSPVNSGVAAGDSHRLRIQSSESILLSVALDGTGANIRSAATPASVLTALPKFVTVECNMAMPTEATQVVVTVDLALQTMVFGQEAGTAAAMPSAFQMAALAISLFNNRSDATSNGPLMGRVSKNQWILTSKMPAATEGLLTPTARENLRNFEPLT